jgi:hypothetical protein
MPSSDFTPNDVWGSNPATAGEFELTLPSGQTCRAKKIGMEGLLEMGILDQADSLTAMAEKHTSTQKKGGPDGPTIAKVNEAGIMADPEAMKAIIGLTDRALPIIVISPPVALHYSERMVGKTKHTKMLNDDERALMRADKPNLVFTDQIGFDDKMFLFDWAAGGLSALVPFRGGSTTDVANVAPRTKPKGKAKRAPRGQ